VEIDALLFRLEGKPLFWKKFIVSRAEIAGIHVNTPRRRSGALPRATETPDEPSVVVEKSKEAANAAWSNLKDAYDPKTLFNPDKLASLQLAREAQAHFTEVSQAFPARIDSLNTDDLARRIQDFAERARSAKISGLEGIEKARALASEAESLRKDVRAKRDEFQALSRDIQAEAARAKATLKDLDRLKKQDLEGALGTIQGGLSVQGLTRGLLGPAWFAKLNTALGWLRKIQEWRGRDDVDGQDAPAPPPPPRRTGRDVTFPFHHHWPTFHLKLARLSGVTPGDDPLSYEGTLKDVSSEPRSLGRPITVAIEGAQGERALTAEGRFDFSGPALHQEIHLDYRGFSVGGVSLGNVAGPVAVASGRGRITAGIEARGNALSGRVDLAAAPLALTHTPTGDSADRLAVALHDVVTGISRAEAAFHVAGTLTSPNIRLTTTLDDQLNAAVRQALQKQLDGLKDQARERLEELVGGEQKKLQELIDRHVGGLSAKLGLKDKDLGGLEGQAQKIVDDLKSQGTKSLLGDSQDLRKLMNLFKKR
jgi:uncharacterized protein (TIGR03545 family)